MMTSQLGAAGRLTICSPAQHSKLIKRDCVDYAKDGW